MTKFIHNYLQESVFDAMAAIPLDREKKRNRGFNQSELVAKALSAKLKLPHASRGLSRTKSFSPQSLLPKKDRESNVKGCFTVRDTGLFAGKRILLIDDILTTGQTASECAKTLKEAGARSVTVLACARGI